MNFKDNNGTPIIMNAKVDVVPVFLEHACPNIRFPQFNLDLNATDMIGQTLVMSLAGQASFEILEQMVKGGANLSLVNNQRRSALNRVLDRVLT